MQGKTLQENQDSIKIPRCLLINFKYFTEQSMQGKTLQELPFVRISL